LNPLQFFNYIALTVVEIDKVVVEIDKVVMKSLPSLFDYREHIPREYTTPANPRMVTAIRMSIFFYSPTEPKAPQTTAPAQLS
jgi:hypothetical protein